MSSVGRRLAAVLVADVVGFSAMMAEDEDGTLSSLRAHRNVLDPVVLNHGGRIVKATGDGVLVEFPSATSALEAAAESQTLMEARNKTLPESRRMQFRIGINLGDVVGDESGDIFGDGVNVAARIEPLADPGGVAVSDSVARSVSGTSKVELSDAGEHSLKNIPRPVRIWKMHSRSGQPVAAVSPERRVVATVAVLPFNNMSADPDQEYFVDGITEDLITALSHDSNLAVVARNSTFVYKNQATDTRVIARELDATHIVEGSARKAGSQVRVTAQLIDAETGHHIWAERYDRELEGVFELQDELVRSIASRLGPSLWDSAGRPRSGSFDAWDLTLRGNYELNKWTADSMVTAIESFDQARELDPEFAPAIARSAYAWMGLWYLGWRSEDVNPWDRGQSDAGTAYRLDPNDYTALGAAAVTTTVAGSPEEGIGISKRMIELNPYAAYGYHWLGLGLCSLGRYEEAIQAQTEAWRLGRHEPWHFDTAVDLSYSHYLAGLYEPAVEWANESLKLLKGNLQSHFSLAASYAQLGKEEQARPHVEAILAERPDFDIGRFRSHIVYVRDDDRDHIVEGLIKAGLLE